MVIISLANKYAGEKHLMNVLLFQHVCSSVSSCGICPRRWERSTLFLDDCRMPHLGLRACEACRERKELEEHQPGVSGTYNKLLPNMKKVLGAAGSELSAFFFTSVVLKCVSGRVIRENNNPISLFVAARCILSTNDCWEMTPKGMWSHSAPLYW